MYWQGYFYTECTRNQWNYHHRFRHVGSRRRQKTLCVACWGQQWKPTWSVQIRGRKHQFSRERCSVLLHVEHSGFFWRCFRRSGSVSKWCPDGHICLCWLRNHPVSAANSVRNLCYSKSSWWLCLQVFKGLLRTHNGWNHIVWAMHCKELSDVLDCRTMCHLSDWKNPQWC